MAFARPSFSTLYQQALNDILSQSGTTSLLRRAVLPAIAFSLAGLAWLHYGYLDYIAQQATPFTATAEFLYAWGALKGIPPKAASIAAGSATFTGANGASIVAGAIVVRGDGVNYSVTTTGYIASSTVTVPVAALIAGVAGNAASGLGVTLSSPSSGVNAGGVVASAIGGGADAELDGPYRTRMLLAYATPPQGGAQGDYVTWAMSAPGVTRAWVTPLDMGAGTVSVFFMSDITEAAFGGFPQGTNGVAALETRATAATGDQLAVANLIFPLRPVIALVYAKAPASYPVNFTISNLDASTTITRAAIITALGGAFTANAAPTGTLYPTAVPGVTNGTIYPSSFSSAIASVAGVNRFTLTSPSGPITAPAGAIPTLGTVTFV